MPVDLGSSLMRLKWCHLMQMQHLNICFVSDLLCIQVGIQCSTLLAFGLFVDFPVFNDPSDLGVV